jgi:uncharacterized protein
MRIAALADLHYSPPAYDRIREAMGRVRDEADVLVIAGDLTNFGQPEEMESLLQELAHLRIPIIAVLGNHDYESDREDELARMLTAEGVVLLDGTAHEMDGVGFAGAKGFIGGYGRGVLTPFGEREIKAFVQASIDETVKLERALAQVRAEKTVVVVHYSPIAATITGENPEIFPFMGTSRLAEVIDRHEADLVVHGHAHHGQPRGETIGGTPVYNVVVSLLLETEGRPYRLFDV